MTRLAGAKVTVDVEIESPSGFSNLAFFHSGRGELLHAFRNGRRTDCHERHNLPPLEGQSSFRWAESGMKPLELFFDRIIGSDPAVSRQRIPERVSNVLFIVAPTIRGIVGYHRIPNDYLGLSGLAAKVVGLGCALVLTISVMLAAYFMGLGCAVTKWSKRADIQMIEIRLREISADGEAVKSEADLEGLLRQLLPKREEWQDLGWARETEEQIRTQLVAMNRGSRCVG